MFFHHLLNVNLLNKIHFVSMILFSNYISGLFADDGIFRRYTKNNHNEYFAEICFTNYTSALFSGGYIKCQSRHFFARDLFYQLHQCHVPLRVLHEKQSNMVLCYLVQKLYRRLVSCWWYICLLHGQQWRQKCAHEFVFQLYNHLNLWWMYMFALHEQHSQRIFGGDLF